METLSKEEMVNIMGGGVTVLPDGTRIYWPDGDEEGDDDDMIFA